MSTQRDVAFPSGSLRLAGTLALPDGEGPRPAVLLVPGSGRVDRNENTKLSAIDALHQVAQYLAVQGVATLRYDKRGIGQSEGDDYESGFFDHVFDASSALDYLKSREAIRADLALLLGHSEGARIAIRMPGTGTEIAGLRACRPVTVRAAHRPSLPSHHAASGGGSSENQSSPGCAARMGGQARTSTDHQGCGTFPSIGETR